MLLLFALCWTAVGAKAGSTPFSTNINNMWLSGNKAAVLALANQRLQKNSNDIAGLLLTLEYQAAFFDITNFNVTANKVIAVGGGITTKNFAAAYPALKGSLQYLLQNEPVYTPAQIQAETTKGNNQGQAMCFLNALQAAELDGLIP